jgi:hypothetical protein
LQLFNHDTLRHVNQVLHEMVVSSWLFKAHSQRQATTTLLSKQPETAAKAWSRLFPKATLRQPVFCRVAILQEPKQTPKRVSRLTFFFPLLSSADECFIEMANLSTSVGEAGLPKCSSGPWAISWLQHAIGFGAISRALSVALRAQKKAPGAVFSSVRVLAWKKRLVTGCCC